MARRGVRRVGRAMGRGLAPAAAASLRAFGRSCALRPRGEVRVPGLAGEVVVRFDEYAVPHVRARSDADAFLAHGFCHALHRFFQMDMLRRVLSGRLAETVGVHAVADHGFPPFGTGRTTVDADRLMRVFDLRRAARRSFELADAQDRALLDAYVQGVNGALRHLRRRRPPEHRLLRLPLEPWTAEDSLLLAKGMALGLSFKWRTAPVFAAIRETLEERPELLEALLPATRAGEDAAVTSCVRRGIGQALAFLPRMASPAGSNAFLIGRGRSAGGAPLLASDPHLELAVPSIWYLSSVRGRHYAAVGCSLPGLPGIVIGRTPTVAWGLTNGMVDDADLWTEEIDGNESRYRVDGRWRSLEVETQAIGRRGRSPVMFRMRRTHRGPVFTDGFPGYDGPPLSLRMALHEPARDLQTFLSIGRARHADELRAAAGEYGAPVQNLLYACADGEAGYRQMGRVPVRRPDTGHVAFPRDGRDSRTDWDGWIRGDEMPQAVLGPDDTLASANESPVDASYPHYLSHLYEPPYRGRRIRTLLAARPKLDIEDLARIQMDVHDLAATWFRTSVVQPHMEAVRRVRPSLGRLLDRLLAWSGEERADAVGPALWHLTYHHLLRRTFGPGLGGPLLDRWLGLVNLMDAPLQRAFEDPDSPWAPPAVRAALLQRALEDAADDLRSRGLDEDAPWGAMHRLTLRHPFSSVPALGRAFDLGPMPYPGGPFAVASGQHSHVRPGAVSSGSSYRQVVDLADAETRSRMITLAGQSGVLGSPHYDDLNPLWLAGEGLPMRLEEEPSRGDVLRLYPA